MYDMSCCKRVPDPLLPAGKSDKILIGRKKYIKYHYSWLKMGYNFNKRLQQCNEIMQQIVHGTRVRSMHYILGWKQVPGWFLLVASYTKLWSEEPKIWNSARHLVRHLSHLKLIHWQYPSVSDQTISQQTLHKTYNPLQTFLRLSFRRFAALLVISIIRHFFGGFVRRWCVKGRAETKNVSPYSPWYGVKLVDCRLPLIHQSNTYKVIRLFMIGIVKRPNIASRGEMHS
jgi:hypothetical protein